MNAIKHNQKNNNVIPLDVEELPPTLSEEELRSFEELPTIPETPSAMGFAQAFESVSERELESALGELAAGTPVVMALTEELYDLDDERCVLAGEEFVAQMRAGNLVRFV